MTMRLHACLLSVVIACAMPFASSAANPPAHDRQPDSAPARAYRHAAQRLIEEVGKRPRASIPILSSLL